MLIIFVYQSVPATHFQAPSAYTKDQEASLSHRLSSLDGISMAIPRKQPIKPFINLYHTHVLLPCNVLKVIYSLTHSVQ